MAGELREHRSILAAYEPEVERLRHEPGGGFRILELLSQDGWFVAVLPGLFERVLLLAQRDGLPDVRADGISVQAAAPDLYYEALAISSQGRYH